MPPRSQLPLPAGFILVADLAQHGLESRVVRVRRDGEDLVLRLDASGDTEEVHAELSVLAHLSHPGLCGLVEFGSLPDGRGTWVARTWIEGQDLATWARGHSREEACGVVVRMTPALEYLHRAGFVHGDLKGDNVIVSPDGRPTITDFGLARRTGGTGAVSGTLFAIAPEVLLGSTPDGRSDLFALGVLLHELLIGQRTTAREFYGRFPQEDFFRATRTSPADLPTWARDVVSALLERDPGQRPGSAAELGRTLSTRLEIESPFQAAPPPIAWPVRSGREAWIDEVMTGLRSAPAPGSPQLEWLRFSTAEAPLALTRELALIAAVGGTATLSLDLTLQLQNLTTGAALDTWARSLSAGHPGALLFTTLRRDDSWSQRGVEALARALNQSAREVGARAAARLVVGATQAPVAGDLPWRAWNVPPVSADDIATFLEEHLAPEPPERVQAAAQLFAAASAGSATALDQVLHSASRNGWVLAGDERPRLRPGPLPLDLGQGETGDLIELEQGSAGPLLLAACQVLGRTSIFEAGDLAGLPADELAAGLATLLGHDLVSVRRQEQGAVLERTSAPLERVRGLPEEAIWQRMHAERAHKLADLGASEAEQMPHRYRAGLATPGEVLELCQSMRERGSPEQALDLCENLQRQTVEAGRELDPELVAERAFAWCELGQPGRGSTEIEPLAAHAAPAVRALVERVRAQIATLAHEPARALEHLEAALELAPEDGGHALLGKGRLYYELGRDEELLALVRDVSPDGARPADFLGRAWANLRALQAMALLRTGQVDLARTALEAQAAEARADRDPGREAGLRINLATLERRSGDPREAREHLEQAAEHYDKAGLLPGLAQARALLGGLLRELGELSEAQAPLASALAIRERLGDAVGAMAVRGMLGLLLAERGHVLPATEELERSAARLRESGRTRDALLLEARGREARARIGVAPTGPDSEEHRVGEGDPRILLSLGRAAWLANDESAARDLVGRASQLAEALGLLAVHEEASFLVRRLAGEVAREPGQTSAPLAREDEQLCALLGNAPFEAEAAIELADRLVERGRDDRAARILLAWVARQPTGEAAEAIAERANAALERCATGLIAPERASLLNNLLGFPDPWPEDLQAWQNRTSTEEDFEMEVIKLLEINHRLVTQEDLGTLLGTIVEHALTVSGAQRGFLILEQDGELKVDTAMDSRRGGIEAPDVEVSGSVLTRALHEMRPIRISNAVDDPLLGSAPSVVELELRSILCVPFTVQKNVCGVIYVDHRLREAAFDDRTERLLTLLADQAALAIMQVRRMQDIRRLNRELKRRVVEQESDLQIARQALRVVGLPGPAGGLVGSSPLMRAVHRQIALGANTQLPVLVGGASGTGKELAARALHDQGPRAREPFVGENCAAIPPTLIEAELFGAKKGAFTGADADRLGFFERAHGGTLFLDEIGELPIELQAKLLRVLETNQIRRIGDTRTRDVNFRLIAATNRDLSQEVDQGRFRADLYYRLDGLRIQMPALQDHAEDIPALVDHYLRTQAPDGVRDRKISQEVITRLCNRAWPGNVRELFNELGRLCVLSEGDIDDPELVRTPGVPAAQAMVSGMTMAAIERAAIENALQQMGGDKRKAAELLGISRAKIYQRLKEWAED